MSLKCYYHPEREAQSKCEKCGKLICLECKRVFNVTHGVDESRYSTRHEFCQICYFDRGLKTAKHSSTGCIICIIMDTLMIVLTIVIPYSMGFYDIEFFKPAIYIPVIILSIGLIIAIILFLYMKFIYGPKKVVEITTQKENYLRSLKYPSKEKEIIPPSKRFCHECGNQIDSNVSICPHCGNDMDEKPV